MVVHQLAVPVNQVNEFLPTILRVRLIRERSEFIFQHFELSGEMHRDVEEEAITDSLQGAYGERLENLNGYQYRVLFTGH